MELGRTQAYLGRCQVDDVRRCRERFGGVTLQGLGGLKIAKALARAGDLTGVDLDPATYRARPAKASNQLALPGMDIAPFDWIAAQAELGLPVVRTPGTRIRVGRVEELRAELDRDYPVDVTVMLALDAGWLGPRHIGTLEHELKVADRDVSLSFAAPVNPLDTRRRIDGLRRLLRWAADSRRGLELLRVDLSGLPAVIEGASVIAIGLGPSTRRVSVPLATRGAARAKPSPFVFVPRLLDWQRANVIGGLSNWNGAGLTYCDCAVCADAGQDLLRFDRPQDPKVAEEIRRHDELALSGVIRQIMSSDNPEAELKFRRVNAVQRAKAVSSSLNVELTAPPAWLDSWD
ncbi:MAG TPA: hypothetical protein VGX25_23125 [Actinophytocola sp.]|uniref:hypothetical protein n=1 Tax=Actinophytocola sp. TaxID=1872138 RepID=UPI002DDD5EB5|nr:hypothetical protein [Actinophytocola sp.]HEV2782294.1 hypothetical protein [Actinophytocola sp.]